MCDTTTPKNICNTTTPRESIDVEWIPFQRNTEYITIDIETLRANKIHRQIKKILEG